MKGSYHYDEKAKRYYVQIYWEKKHHRIYRYKDEAIWHEKTADKLLNKIRAEIDDGTFNLKSYFPASPLYLKAYAEQWLKASTACNNTKRTYRWAIKHSIEYPGFGPSFDIRQFTYSKLQIFYNDLPLTEKGKYNVLNTLKTMLAFAYKDEFIKKIPPFPATADGKPQEIEYLTIEEQNKVLANIAPRHRPVYEFAMEFGLRIGEVRALQKDCIKDGELIIKRSFSQNELRQTTKTNRIRYLPMTERALEILKRTPPTFSEFLFSANGKDPYSLRSLDKIWREAGEKTGIKIKLYNAVRHSLGCQLMDEGAHLEDVRDILGHTSTEMTRRYAHRVPARMKVLL